MKVCQGKYTVVIIGDQNSIINFTQFEATIWAKHKTQWRWSKFLKIMNLVFGLNDENMTTLEKNTDNVIKLYKCNRFEYASSHKGNLRRKFVEESHTNATNVILHPLTNAL